MELYQSGQMLKHVGAYAGRRVILLMPDQADLNYVYVIELERLPHSLEEIISREVTSAQAQQPSTIWFVDTLMGIQYDGVNMVQFLFKTAGAIARAEMNQVLMIPMPGNQIKLADVYEAMLQADTRLTSAFVAWKASSPSTPSPFEVSNDLTSIAQHNDNIDASESNKAIARNLLAQANMLQADADSKFEEAYKYDPSLRPATGWVDEETGKTYKTESALKAAISRRENAKVN